MKILLINPTFHYKEGGLPLSCSDFPSGYGYMAATLQQAGHEVAGLNPNNIMGYSSVKFMLQDVLSKKVKETTPDFVGIGGLCTDYAFLKDAINIIRGVDSNIPIILGGQIVTNDAEFIFQDLKPDYAMIGEADEAIVDLIADKPPPGLMRTHTPENLDSLPFPDYEPFNIKDMLDKHSMDTRLLYRYSRPYPRPFNIVASRSCPFNCTFCVHQHRSIPYRARSIDNIMEEIRVMYEKYEFNILIILDELFAVNNKRMLDFSNAVLAGKEQYHWDFDWMFQTHASAKLNLPVLKLAKEAGCFFFSYGLESASESVLKSMNKKIHVEQVEEAIKLAEDSKIGFGAILIFGVPAETVESWAESLAFWLVHGRNNLIFLANLSPYPGSKVFEDCQAKGLFQDKKYYYEHIDEAAVNMTAIPEKAMADLMNLTALLERAWLFVPLDTNIKCERESLNMFKIWGTCPHCGEESLYRQTIPDVKKDYMMGTSCVKCNRRIKLIISKGEF